MYRLNNIKRNIFIVSCATLFSGCGGGGDSTTSSTSSTSTTSTTSAIEIQSAQLSDNAASIYLEPINIPTYNANDTTHILITEANGNWTSIVLNNPEYQHFYIEPGNYTSKITLTADGTSTQRRTISLHDGNDIHPASLSTAEQANVKLAWDGASYWDIDRLSFLSNQATTDERWFDNSSNYNTLNRINLKDFYFGINIMGSSSYNSIQNSYIDHMTHEGRLSDNVGIALQSRGATSTSPVYSIKNKIINNDIRNAGDGIQLARKPGEEENAFYDGTIIDSNRIWTDSEISTNGDYSTNGYNPTGEYMIAENALDFKGGSNNSLEPVVVTNNIMWGYKEGDTTTGGAQSGGQGTAVVIHYEVKNLLFGSNIIFDTMVFLASSDPLAGQDYSMTDCTFINNIFYRSCYSNPENKDAYPLFMYTINNIKNNRNSLIDLHSQTGEGNWMGYLENTPDSGTTFSSNLIIDAEGYTTDNAGATVTGNYYYNTTKKFPTTGTDIIGTLGTQAMGDYTFKYERFTASPKSEILTGVVSTVDSPHYGVAGSSITQGTSDVY